MISNTTSYLLPVIETLASGRMVVLTIILILPSLATHISQMFQARDLIFIYIVELFIVYRLTPNGRLSALPVTRYVVRCTPRFRYFREIGQVQQSISHK